MIVESGHINCAMSVRELHKSVLLCHLFSAYNQRLTYFKTRQYFHQNDSSMTMFLSGKCPFRRLFIRELYTIREYTSNILNIRSVSMFPNPHNFKLRVK